MKFPPPVPGRSSLGVGCILLSPFGDIYLLCAQSREGHYLSKATVSPQGKLQRTLTPGITSSLREHGAMSSACTFGLHFLSHPLDKDTEVSKHVSRCHPLYGAVCLA